MCCRGTRKAGGSRPSETPGAHGERFGGAAYQTRRGLPPTGWEVGAEPATPVLSQGT